MSGKRMDRVNELLRREIGNALFQLVDGDSVNLAAVTVSHVITSVNLRHARVLVSVLGTPVEQQAALNAIRRQRIRIQDRIAHALILKYTPRLAFELDTSIAQGDHILQLLDEIDRTRGDAPDNAGEPAPDDDAP